jgi:hypothetical protein
VTRDPGFDEDSLRRIEKPSMGQWMAAYPAPNPDLDRGREAPPRPQPTTGWAARLSDRAPMYRFVSSAAVADTAQP